ncbi:MAG: class I SAM-dependent methyltransferase [Candidatus Scalindua sp.]|jgi:SAM-dependent methyltransferase|nr:class I SAM-dependent methyltransferase [Candidatus Scalindua sp.]
MGSKSLVSYYQESHFNPVPIDLQTSAEWQSHVTKRRNLYEKHLNIPFVLLSGHSVLEFGCNSGENSLVLASFGANLTLVEANEQVLSRLKENFKRRNLEDQITSLINGGIENFESDRLYDIVLAEGFLFSLPNRDDMVQKICDLLAPGGIGIISFNDRYGGLLEMIKKMFLYRSCQLEKVSSVQSHRSMELSKIFFEKQYAELNASRPFEAWWRDVLINPFYGWKYFWSFPEILLLLERGNTEVYSSSPPWISYDHFDWYKNVMGPKERHSLFLENWRQVFPYFLTQHSFKRDECYYASSEVTDSFSDLIFKISEFTREPDCSPEILQYPKALDQYLSEIDDHHLHEFNRELKEVFFAIKSVNNIEELLDFYSSKKIINLWGKPYHYISFCKL